MLQGYRRQDRPYPVLPETLPALLRERATGPGADRTALYYVDRESEPVATATYGELYRRSSGAARALEAHGVRAGDAVVLLTEPRLEFYYGLFGTMLLGARPVAVYPPLGTTNLVPAITHLRAVAQQLDAACLFTTPTLFGVADAVRQGGRPRILVVDTVPEVEGRDTAGLPSGDAPVPLQYTSGSVGRPKAIALSTRSIHENLLAIGDAFGMQEGDVGCSWLPLYHDMGLHSIFFDLMFEMPLVLLSPFDFLKRPSAWLRAIHRYGVTHSPAPNFGYAFATRRIKDRDLEGVDLSRWRVAMCGAEPIDARVLAAFGERFAAWGFSPRAFMPAYGLAENTVAVSFAPPQTGAVVERLDAARLAAEARAVPAEEGLAVVSVGHVIDGHTARIVDPGGAEVPEGGLGEIQVRGPGRMEGYWEDPEATRASFDGEWLVTGDLGFVRGRELFVTGRKKDLIIRGGRNYYPQEIEAAATIDGVRPGCVIAFGRRDPALDTEEIVVVAEVRRDADAGSETLAGAVRTAVRETVGLTVADVKLVPRNTVPKTTSGKLQRLECKRRYEAGTLTPPKGPGLLTLARVGAVTVLPPALQRLWERVRRALGGSPPGARSR